MGALEEVQPAEAFPDCILGELGDSSELESRLRAAMEDVRQGNGSLEAELAQLRRENQRLRRDRDKASKSVAASAAATPRFDETLQATPAKKSRNKKTLLGLPAHDEDASMSIMDITLEPETAESIEEQRHKDLSVVLRRQALASTAPIPSPKRALKPLPGNLVPEDVQRKAVRVALHSLVCSLAR
mmetsp:Transcript_5250/g.12896  ORF Transcript_5250/g.12896 Transcript_5250/m.12896 type:complete len:186 (+) Transcript_5250:3-560(+)